ncbi:MAG TPA: class I SAM-dependent methyltransferase [Candidatus Binatia bacterium]|nr:class I SAM-dependent methyltransferase [Candidatus Binatia bacterium]
MAAGERPFYGRFAWAYDLLADRPVARECAWVAAALSARGVGRGTRVLDAGCATGRYALALADHGYRILGVDRSPGLIAVARRRGVRCVVADLTALPLRRVYGAVLCRGVLNDVLDDEPRRAVFRAFAGALGDGGVLVLDVRDWDATVRRKTAEPVHERTVETEQGRLTFRSETRLDAATRRMLIAERHVLVSGGETRSESHDFVMRCWTRAELDERLREAGFAPADCRGAYDDAVPVGATDRIVAVAGMLKP